MRSDRRRLQATRAAAEAARRAAIHRNAMSLSLLPARSRLRAALLASVCLGAFAALTPSSAQTIDGTWLGGGAPVTNEWTQGNNWSSNPDVPDRWRRSRTTRPDLGHDLSPDLDWHDSVHVWRTDVFLRRQFRALRNQWRRRRQQFRVRAEFH
jgi:hypothetical protein